MKREGSDGEEDHTQGEEMPSVKKARVEQQLTNADRVVSRSILGHSPLARMEMKKKGSLVSATSLRRRNMQFYLATMVLATKGFRCKCNA